MKTRSALLIVDDEPIQRAWVRGVLATDDWQVSEAVDGADGVDAVAAGAFALVLMDIQMPVLDGYGAVAAIRARDDASATTPIIAFTALRMPDPDAHFRAAGMDGHLAKPGTPDALRAAVAPWRLTDGPGPRERLGSFMSVDDVSGLLVRFRIELVDALAQIDRPADRIARAHKLAGLAGTLGFRQAHGAWLALSEGVDAALEPARVSARMAIGMIDRDLEMHRGA